MKRKQEKGTEKIRREPPVVEFGRELTLALLFFLCGLTLRKLYFHFLSD